MTERDPAADYRRDRRRLVERLRDRGVSDLAVLHAFDSVPRHAFVPDVMRARAYEDVPLPIGRGQTISSPTIHALSLEYAEVRPDHRVLEVGTGAGFQTALLAALGARVYSIERIASLYEAAARRLDRLGVDARLMHGDGSRGWPRHAPFQAIIVGAAAARPPEALFRQLADGGRLIVPVGTRRQELRRYTRCGDHFATETITGARFVPLIENEPRGGGPE
ncbi:MAG: protein-L-isoaspartate(D-aspartate) O-methyltransferase [Gemmatimonadales bacterium]|nr:protein-L-isoaspartate(D-aspartate) O-methyltransferase [Gemmatimonadales bacterium]MYG48196.1 protein-L-isoaspartate(D-aspartate) O-methyltransferase [Gemmatimonadales bacterium]MYK00789.1 protein-L-isoaspartate(D-aspartate) O-methyltransferase [Candidatus Palauibacter ramosifaciens]